MTTLPPFDAVLLAGGASRRMGEDKALLTVGGQRLLDRVLAAVGHAEHVIAVGPPRPTNGPVSWTSEEPAEGGPAAGLQAGLALVRSPVVVVAAVDLPFLDAGSVDLLRRSVRGDVGAVLTDDSGREQLTVSAWSVGALQRIVRGHLHGASLRSALAPLSRRRVGAEAGRPPAWVDCDTPAQLEYADALLK